MVDSQVCTSRPIDQISQLLDKSGQFVAEQAPPLAREVIMYGRYYHAIMLAISVLALLAGITWYVKSGVHEWTDGDEFHAGRLLIIPMILGTIPHAWY